MVLCKVNAAALLLTLSCGAFALPEPFPAVGRFCDVPAELLYSVAVAESGRYHAGSVSPWPWTLNVEGEGYFFESRDALYEAFLVQIREGRSVDVGLMQLNWGWKFDLLQSPWIATDPMSNVLAACRVLRGHYDGKANGNWLLAAGYYNRESDDGRSRVRRLKYMARVESVWSELR